MYGSAALLPIPASLLDKIALTLTYINRSWKQATYCLLLLLMVAATMTLMTMLWMPSWSEEQLKKARNSNCSCHRRRRPHNQWSHFICSGRARGGWRSSPCATDHNHHHLTRRHQAEQLQNINIAELLVITFLRRLFFSAKHRNLLITRGGPREQCSGGRQ